MFKVKKLVYKCLEWNFDWKFVLNVCFRCNVFQVDSFRTNAFKTNNLEQMFLEQML